MLSFKPIVRLLLVSSCCVFPSTALFGTSVFFFFFRLIDCIFMVTSDSVDFCRTVYMFPETDCPVLIDYIEPVNALFFFQLIYWRHGLTSCIFMVD